MLWRSLLGGAVSLTVGISAAVIAVLIGVSIGAISGYAGGRIDALCMRFVDVVYGLPYILLVVLISLALQPLVVLALRSVVKTDAADGLASIVSILIAVGGVSWLTMARVIRGQVLSLRKQPFVEAARACGLGPMRILLRHITPNLVSPIIVYATLAVPAAILQESLLSFLGIGINPSVPSWGNMASAGLGELDKLTITGGRMDWWLLLWPCLLLGLTLLSLNFLGDALRNRFDPQIAR